MMIKLSKSFAILSLAMLIASCATTARFPVSTIVPAAEINAKKKKDNNGNYILELTANNLASADRLQPAGNNYSVWIATKKYGVKNIGQLNIKNAKKSNLKVTSAFDFDEVFITVEQSGNLKYPKGAEITRTKI